MGGGLIVLDKQKKFSFCVLTYNQQESIIETLESIKYQIMRFGKDLLFNLYIIDDASTDFTGVYIQEWLSANGRIFKKVDVQTNEINFGTVYSYNCLMDKVNNEMFKVIAGDDLIGPYNIFDKISDKKDKLYTFPYLKLQNGDITYSKRYLYDYFYKKKKYEKYRNCNWMRVGNFIHTPSTFYMKSLYLESNSKKFNSQFILFEDDPTFYSFFKNNVDVIVDFGLIPVVLYRYTTKSTSTVPNRVFLEDWSKLQSIYINDTKGFEKLYLKFRLWSYFNNRLLYFMLEGTLHLLRVLTVQFLDHKGFKNFENNIKKHIDDYEYYYRSILETNKHYRRNELCK